MDGISLTQILVIGLIVLILFGSKKLPEFGKSIGKSIRSFKDGLSEIDAESKDVSNQITQQNQTDAKATAKQPEKDTANKS